MRGTTLFLFVILCLQALPAQAGSRFWRFHDLGQIRGQEPSVPLDLNDQSMAAFRLNGAGERTHLGIHMGRRLLGVELDGIADIFAIDDDACVTGLMEDGALFRWCMETGLEHMDNPCHTISSVRSNSLGDMAALCSPEEGPSSVLLIQGTRVQILDDFGLGVLSVTDINDMGDIIGLALVAPGISHAYVMRSGQILDITGMGGDQSIPFDINNHGVVVGAASDAFGNSRPFVWDQEQGLRPLNLEPLSGQAIQINDSGQIIGNYTDPTGLERGFLHDGEFHPLSPDNMGSMAMGLNDLGDVTGLVYNPDGEIRSGFLHTEGRLYAIPCLPLEDVIITPLPGSHSAVGTLWLSEEQRYAFQYSPIFGFSTLARFLEVDHRWQILDILDINTKGELMGIAYSHDASLHVYLMTRDPSHP